MADLGVRDVQEVGSFGKIAPHQAVGVFVGPALPRGIRVGEEKVRFEFARHGLVAGELGAVVGGDGQYPVPDRSQQANHHPPHRIGAPVGHPAQQDETAAALGERDEVASSANGARRYGEMAGHSSPHAVMLTVLLWPLRARIPGLFRTISVIATSSTPSARRQSGPV